MAADRDSIPEFPVSDWVAALEAAIRVGDFASARDAAEELQRRGIRLSAPGFGERRRVASNGRRAERGVHHG